MLAAIALRVRDAGHAFRHSLELGAWEMPTRAAAMELHIPGIHGAGDSLVYFVDRYRDFSIYDVDFVSLPGAPREVPALAGLHWFGVVQTILPGRTGDWLDFYRALFGFEVLPRGQYFGVLPKGTPRVAVEMGTTDGWWKYGVAAVVGIDTYGESAPAGVLFKHFGFTAENVAATVEAALKR